MPFSKIRGNLPFPGEHVLKGYHRWEHLIGALLGLDQLSGILESHVTSGREFVWILGQVWCADHLMTGEYHGLPLPLAVHAFVFTLELLATGANPPEPSLRRHNFARSPSIHSQHNNTAPTPPNHQATGWFPFSFSFSRPTSSHRTQTIPTCTPPYTKQAWASVFDSSGYKSTDVGSACG